MDEIELRPQKELLSMLGQLTAAMAADAERFIATVFDSTDSEWVSRCDSIVEQYYEGV